MPDKWPLANGNWSNAANWNGGTKPVAGDDVYADGKTVSVDENFTVATIRNTQRTGGTVGGTFVFDTAGVTGTITDAIQPIFQSTGNVIQITATTGTVTLTTTANIVGQSNTQIINHSGNCNFIVNTPSVICTSTVNAIIKGSGGTITLNCDLSTNQGTPLTSTNGNTIVNGNCIGSGVNFGQAVTQTAGNLTINGNITGNRTGATSTITFSGAQITLNGNISASLGLNTTSPTTINGNVTATSTLAAISSTAANQIIVNGTVTASASAVAISMTNANGQVYLNGNMVNNNGKMAIFAPIVWLDRTGTTSAAFFTSGGGNRTLYSADTVPNTPAASNVRKGVVYGAGNSLTGTLAMPVAADAASGVVYDNGTTGTALFTTATLLSQLNSSSDAVAVRIRNAATPDILGELMEAFKK